MGFLYGILKGFLRQELLQIFSITPRITSDTSPFISLEFRQSSRNSYLDFTRNVSRGSTSNNFMNCYRDSSRVFLRKFRRDSFKINAIRIILRIFPGVSPLIFFFFQRCVESSEDSSKNYCMNSYKDSPMNSSKDIIKKNRNSSRVDLRVFFFFRDSFRSFFFKEIF